VELPRESAVRGAGRRIFVQPMLAATFAGCSILKKKNAQDFHLGHSVNFKYKKNILSGD
jgi:hypothetical protein